MTTNQQADPLIGRLVDGRYRVRARIARGGMATVYVATDLRLERRIALKVMHAHLSDDSAFQSRFIQEARAAARLADPHVVNVFDQGQDGELAYLVMEYLPGITLRELLREQKRLTIPQTITIMDAILAGLSAAHRASIVHRDVKPENVLLAEDGRIKIGDFGLARATTANTATGQQLLGTIAYLAPELVTRGTADARSDIYALGIMLYEMLVGEQPYKGEQPMQIAFQHATESVPRPSARNPAVPEQLDELVLWATEKSPDERPDDAQQMLDRLREIERDLGIAPTAARATAPQHSHADSGDLTKVMPGTMVIADPTAPVPAAIDNATLLRRRASKRRARGAFLLTLVLLLAVLAGGVGWWFGSGPGSLIAVPTVAGGTYDDAATVLTEAGFVPTQKDEFSIDIPAGTVIETDPGEGTRLDKGAPVAVIVSAGPANHTLDALNGRAEQDARDYLTGLNVKVTDESLLLFSDADAGIVINAYVTPRAGGDAYICGDGCEIFEDDTVELYVSAGDFPDVSGMSVGEATSTLTDKGLTVTTDPQYVFSDSVAKDVVIGVADRAEEGNWRPGDNVQLIVSKGPELFPVPDVSGKTLNDAKKILSDKGFKSTYAAWGDLPGFAEMAKVTGQDPGPDKSLPNGGTVNLSIQLSG
ncbi:MULTISPECIES: Stk1 family PASTA domain-containing Ser/Thr kinase [unclassified Microbacterium]|uniref:Stk1 family PASTA domain-containing Ser/Thr kinase n=1 Tax=unclassified Microbacterium TaxID=2609290 RepID=UPI000CFAD264|nr:MULTISPECIES: Stk1 family PASTA domain-containing Ser/Thr kinase [unclassified Microbacterium]PQZ60451.1 serine/threonine protein kinase [Microbacterium sp. MYb43]PQZ81877.1 serine/threonine protein kinase [Microbacterium sp. MYb40]PRB22140.1 serine/threonine protein kinase [Microbacterium sp. MYb54]PRB31295.1 serine/threonine protein kinase [Microbacterium sp. MYb50]PRB69904.1 serine/threonine protein kinase [Microbacterium sp. MYb24]